MPTIVLTYACGHTQAWADGKNAICPTCGETQIANVKAPPPRIVILGKPWTPTVKKESVHA